MACCNAGTSRRRTFRRHYLSTEDTELMANNHLVDPADDLPDPFLIIDPYHPAKVYFDLMIGGGSSSFSVACRG